MKTTILFLMVISQFDITPQGAEVTYVLQDLTQGFTWEECQEQAILINSESITAEGQVFGFCAPMLRAYEGEKASS